MSVSGKIQHKCCGQCLSLEWYLYKICKPVSVQKSPYSETKEPDWIYHVFIIHKSTACAVIQRHTHLKSFPLKQSPISV